MLLERYERWDHCALVLQLDLRSRRSSSCFCFFCCGRIIKKYMIGMISRMGSIVRLPGPAGACRNTKKPRLAATLIPTPVSCPPGASHFSRAQAYPAICRKPARKILSPGTSRLIWAPELIRPRRWKEGPADANRGLKSIPRQHLTTTQRRLLPVRHSLPLEAPIPRTRQTWRTHSCWAPKECLNR